MLECVGAGAGRPQIDIISAINWWASVVLTRVPKRAQPGVATMVRTMYQQLSPAQVHTQADRVIAQLRKPFPQVAELLVDAAPDILAFTAFPLAHWQKL